jgi:hypothetical protein
VTSKPIKFGQVTSGFQMGEGIQSGEATDYSDRPHNRVTDETQNDMTAVAIRANA